MNSCLLGKAFLKTKKETKKEKEEEKEETEEQFVFENLTINKEDLLKSAKNTKMYKENQINLNNNILNHPKKFETKIFVVEGDCVETSVWFSRLNKRVCLLNNASASNEGGGWRNGSSSQEEYVYYFYFYFLFYFIFCIFLYLFIFYIILLFILFNLFIYVFIFIFIFIFIFLLLVTSCFKSFSMFGGSLQSSTKKLELSYS